MWGSNLYGYGKLGGSNLELDLYGGWRGEWRKGDEDQALSIGATKAIVDSTIVATLGVSF